MNNSSRFDELAKRLFGDQIEQYARGHPGMEASAIDVCRPTIPALTQAEEHASLVLIARMERELEVISRNSGYTGTLGTFDHKIRRAYQSRVITRRMRDALDAVRRIRNCFAHTEDPDTARLETEYTEAKAELLELDRCHTEKCMNSLCELHGNAISDMPLAEPTAVIAVMLNMCEILGLTEFASRFAPQGPHRRIIPAYFGFDDMMNLSDEINKAIASH